MIKTKPIQNPFGRDYPAFPTPHKQIDVIMCVKDPKRKIFAESVRRIRKQPEIGRLIFIVAENSMKKIFDSVILYKKDLIISENVSLSYARRLGIYYSESEYISFIDWDVLIPKNFLRDSIKFMDMHPRIGGANTVSIDTGRPLYGIKPDADHIKMKELIRGLCTANIIRRKLVEDWNPPENLHALEDFLLAHHVRTRGFKWFQMPTAILHITEDIDTFKKRWVWNGSGIRMLKQMKLGHLLPRMTNARSHLYFLRRRAVAIIMSPLYAKRYGINAKAILYEINRQIYLLIGYLKAEKYLKTRRN